VDEAPHLPGASVCSEIGNLLRNNRRQRRTCYALCHILYPVSAAHTSIFRMDSNSTSYRCVHMSIRVTRSALEGTRNVLQQFQNLALASGTNLCSNRVLVQPGWTKGERRRGANEEGGRGGTREIWWGGKGGGGGHRSWTKLPTCLECRACISILPLCK